MLVEEGVSVRGQVASGFTDAEKAGGSGGTGSADGGIGLRVCLRQVRVHELHQRVKSRVQQVGRVQRGDRDGGSGDKRRLGLERLRLELRLRRSSHTDEGRLWSLCVFVRGGLLLLLGNQPWQMKRQKQNQKPPRRHNQSAGKSWSHHCQSLRCRRSHCCLKMRSPSSSLWRLQFRQIFLEQNKHSLPQSF